MQFYTRPPGLRRARLCQNDSHKIHLSSRHSQMCVLLRTFFVWTLKVQNLYLHDTLLNTGFMDPKRVRSNENVKQLACRDQCLSQEMHLLVESIKNLRISRFSNSCIFLGCRGKINFSNFEFISQMKNENST